MVGLSQDRDWQLEAGCGGGSSHGVGDEFAGAAGVSHFLLLHAGEMVRQ